MVRGFIQKIVTTSFQKRPKKFLYPPLPSNISLSEIHQRALIGFIAKEIVSNLLEVNEQVDSLFYQCILSKKNEFITEDPFFLAHKLFLWVQQGENAKQKIEELEIIDRFKEALYKTYKKHEKDILQLQKSICKQEIHRDMGLNQTKELDNTEEWKIYRDVIFAVTQKQFLLISNEELPKYKAGQMIGKQLIQNRSDIPVCREKAREILIHCGFNQLLINSWLLAISEAVTNVIKHADNGEMLILQNQTEIRVIVEDNGNGFDLKDLPNATLMSGYSTKKSLGQGFTLMMKIASQILLQTSSRGSTLILVFKGIDEKEVGNR